MKRIITVGMLVLALSLPAIFKPKGSEPLKGPELANLPHTEVSFRNDLDGLLLSGLLFIPASDGPHPTAVIIHGSGTSRRDNPWYLSVVKALQDNGIAVLLPDKRGSEKSDGNWRGASFEVLANDSVAAVNFLRKQTHFQTSGIGLIGMSQGGWIAPVAASKADKLAFVVSVSGATVTPEEQLVFEEMHNIEPYTYQFIAEWLAPLTSARLMKMDFFQPWIGFDPIAYWQAVDSPVFFAFGEGDTNMPVDASIQRLQTNQLGHHTIKTYPGGGHAIRQPQSPHMNDQFLSDLASFVLRSTE